MLRPLLERVIRRGWTAVVKAWGSPLIFVRAFLPESRLVLFLMVGVSLAPMERRYGCDSDITALAPFEFHPVIPTLDSWFLATIGVADKQIDF